MASLLDALQQNQQQAIKPQGATDETQGIASLMRAKSGKAGAGPSTALSNQQEQAATATGNTNLAQTLQSANLQNQGQQQQSEGLQQQQGAQLTGINQARQQNNQQAQIQTSQMLQNLEQAKGKIGAQQYQAQLEQVGQNLRLSNAQYVDDLQREGNMARLNDSIGFKEQLQQSTFGDSQDLLQKQLGDKSILDVDARSYSKALAQMGVYDSYQVFQSAMENEKQRALYSGISGIATAGIGAAANAANKTPAASSGTNISTQDSPYSNSTSSVTADNSSGRSLNG